MIVLNYLSLPADILFLIFLNYLPKTKTNLLIADCLINYLLTKIINVLLRLIFFCQISPVAHIAAKQSSQTYLSSLILLEFLNLVADIPFIPFVAGRLADIIIVVFLINYLIAKNINGLLHLIFFCHISPVAYIATKQSSQAYLLVSDSADILRS